MFCSECGKPAQGKFCSHCGHALAVAPTGGELIPVDVVQAELVPDWENEVRYEAILKFPGVRKKIERHAAMAPKRMTGEQFLKLADKLMPMGVPMEGLCEVTYSLFSKMGINTGKQEERFVPAPAGQVLVRALCSLARHGQSLRSVTQADDGCLLEAALPSDLLSLEGDLLVTVRRNGGQANVTAAARIGGQMFDWGKSRRCLDTLFDDLARDAA